MIKGSIFITMLIAIVIVVIMVIINISKTSNIIIDTENKEIEIQDSLIIVAVELYMSEHSFEIIFDNNTSYITLSDIDSYIDVNKIVKNSDVYTLETKIEIINNNGSYSYKVIHE